VSLARLAPLALSVALHGGFVALAAVAVPLASARPTEVIPVELVIAEPPPRVIELPPAPPPRLTLPKPVAAPPRKPAAQPEPPVREPEPSPAPPSVSEPLPAAAGPPPAPEVASPPPRVASPAAEPSRATRATPDPTTAPSADAPGPVASSPAPAATPTPGPPTDSGVSWFDGGPSARTPPAVASIPPGEAVTRVARPTGGYQVRPSYPSSARRLGVQGTTLLRVHVLEDGRVGAVDVEQSAGHPDLDRAATDAVRRWRFEPARRGEHAVAMWVRLPVEFRLK
jgi:protein TonB